jgi:hypothetical protein
MPARVVWGAITPSGNEGQSYFRRVALQGLIVSSCVYLLSTLFTAELLLDLLQLLHSEGFLRVVE